MAYLLTSFTYALSSQILPLHSNSRELISPNYSVKFRIAQRRSRTKGRSLNVAAKFDGEDNPTKLVTFLGKGGSGKTTAAIFAAQHYAAAGLSTCLVTHSQNYVAEYLLNCKIGTSPVICGDNLSAVTLETTEMLLEPLIKLKQADARLNMTQGVLEAIVGEELGVLPGMDSIFSVFALDRFVRFFRAGAPKNQKQDKFDVVIYDGINTDQTLRMMGAASAARLYLKYLRVIAEKTDLGRLAGPSLLRLLDEALNLSGSGFSFNGNSSSKIWESLERNLERGSSAYGEPQKFGCYLVTDPCNPASVHHALHYWGCAIQAGAQVSGAFGVASPNFSEESTEDTKNKLLPLPFTLVPHISMGSPPDWDSIMKSTPSQEAQNLLQLPAPGARSLMSSVKFDRAKKAIILFMPGFNKSAIKLFQYRGGSELLVEAGDQRRVIKLPREVQGKVGGAKFMDRSLVVTMQ